MQEDKEREIPKWPFRFLEWFCPPALYEGIEGDLREAFEADCRRYTEAKAKRKLYLNALRFFRPGIVLRNKFTLELINMMMLGNYLKVASRNMMKRKMYSFINAFGLSVGIAFCMLIALYIQDERSFDQFHVNKDRIYRIEEKSYDTWMHDDINPYRKSAWIQAGLAPVIKEEFPEVEYVTRFNSDNRIIFRYEDKVFTEKVTYVDKDFFMMFSFPLIKGDASKLFQDKQEVVITPAIATKYFGDADPVGKTIEIENEGKKVFIVTGVITAPPAQSSLSFEILLPQENRNYYERNVENWGNFGTPTFVQLRKNASQQSFRNNLDKTIEKYVGERLAQWRKEATEKIPDEVKMLEYEFTVLPEMHLKKEISWDKISDPQYSIILGGIGILIILIACINYISLSLTTSASRRIEVGIRKVVGASKINWYISLVLSPCCWLSSLWYLALEW